ncbi:MAG: L-threonylcarbamoyladenylate synthase [Coriobacteriales bacterium]|nr:L-threonylcarbamoyladenylate synthase [Coriobacteriales bacterium]
MGDVWRVSQSAPSTHALREAERVLRGGGVLVMPTDSVYGIGCAATPANPAHERIFAIKRRDRAQTLPWLVADVADLHVYGKAVPAWMDRLAHELWPGALTLVVEASEAVPPEYRGADGTIALRVPNSNLVRALVRAVGPLATTSANTHGEAAATSGAGIEQRIVEQADLTLDAGPAPIAVASTIVGCSGDGPCVYREGAIATARIKSIARGEHR